MNTNRFSDQTAWRALLGVGAALLLATAVPVAAASALTGRWVDVEVQEEGRGDSSPVYMKNGRSYIAGTPGRPYQIVLTNRSPERVLAVVSVDGINVVTGQTAAPSQTGYVLEPFQSTSIDGWRKSMDRVARFEFARVPDSYAAQTGRAYQVGVIGVAVFREARRYRPAMAPSIARDEAAGAPMAKSQRSLGTGHGQSAWSPVSATQFERSSSQPAETLRLDYDRWEALARRGIVPRDRRSRWDDPEPFPNGFVPDPPRRW